MAKRVSIKKIQLADNKLLPLLAISALVLLVFFVSRNPNLVSKITQKTQPSPTETEYPTDTENGGIYVNNEYGFSFEYPAGIFTYEEPISGATALKFSLFEEENNIGKLTLALYVRPKNEEQAFWLLEKLQTLPLNTPVYSDEYLKSVEKENWPIYNYLKIREKIVGGRKLYMYRSYHTGRQIDGWIGSSISIFWIDNENIFTIILSLPADNTRDAEGRLITNGVLDTLEFYNY